METTKVTISDESVSIIGHVYHHIAAAVGILNGEVKGEFSRKRIAGGLQIAKDELSKVMDELDL